MQVPVAGSMGESRVMEAFDCAVVGGGVMGATVALTLARGGMRVVLLEKYAIGSAASGVNAGTLSLQIKRLSLLEYAIRGAEIWSRMAEDLGHDVGFHRTGGFNIAFNEEEAETLRARMGERIEAGLDITFCSVDEVLAREPALSDRIVLASYCALDGFSSSSLSGRAFRHALKAAGVELREWVGVDTISRGGDGFEIAAGSEHVRASRVVLASGAWNGELARQLGVDLPISFRVNQMGVTERTERLLSGVVGHISGLMSLKQADNGTVIIGGGWQGEGKPGEPGRAIAPNLLGNLRFAQHAMPALARLRLVRTWYGYDSVSPDVMPMVGELPNVENAFIIGCVRGGYTIGPYMGRLLAHRVLGKEPELPLFDPARFLTTAE